jgi:hypothetical protein
MTSHSKAILVFKDDGIGISEENLPLYGHFLNLLQMGSLDTWSEWMKPPEGRRALGPCGYAGAAV